MNRAKGGRTVEFSRKTGETDISLQIDFGGGEEVSVDTEVPFFDHLLKAMAFHGHFGFKLRGRGDLAVDEHHLIEDTGIVFGEALNRLLERQGAVCRYAQATIPMDEALSEVVIDVSGRPFLVFTGTFPQERIGSFQAILLREFMAGLVRRGHMAIHAHLRYGNNSHHMAEALFKALGVALARAYAPAPSGGMSTKGTLD
jgi:imidazoleglycerol-phosphate dehydratase